MSVLFTDLVGFTTFSERSTPSEIAAMLTALYAKLAPLITHRYRGQIERLTGDGMLVSLNAHADQADHATLAAATALALQRELERLRAEHTDWPRMRVGISTGEAALREMGGDGYVAYELCGDSVNVGARLEANAPVGGVLISADTHRHLPAGTSVEPRPGLHVKGKDQPVDA